MGYNDELEYRYLLQMLQIAEKNDSIQEVKMALFGLWDLQMRRKEYSSAINALLKAVTYAH